MSAREEQARFFGKLAALVSAGVPLLDALEKAAAGVRSPALAAAISRIVSRAYHGTSVTESFTEESAIFSPEVLSLIEHGERTGDLDRKAAALAAALGDGVFDAPERPDDEDGGLLAAVLDPGAEDAILEAAGGKLRLLLGTENGFRVARVPDPGEAAAWREEAGRREGLSSFRGRTVHVTRCPRRDGAEYVIGFSPATAPAEPPGAAWTKEPGGLIVLAGLPGRRRDTVLAGLLGAAARAGRRTGRRAAVPAAPLPDVIDYDAREVAVWPDLRHLEVLGLSEPATREEAMAAAGAALSGIVVVVPVTAVDGPGGLGRLRELGLPDAAIAAALLGAVVTPPRAKTSAVPAKDLLSGT